MNNIRWTGGVLVSLLCACNSGGGGTGTYFDRSGHPQPGSSAAYVGVWSITAGETVGSCSDGSSPVTSLVGAKLQVTTGSGSELLMSAGGSCTLRFTVGSGDATLSPNQLCQSVQTVNGTTYTSVQHYQSGSLAVIGGQLDFTAVSSGSIVGGSKSLNCMFHQNGAATHQ